jgi:hypothetical protein
MRHGRKNWLNFQSVSLAYLGWVTMSSPQIRGTNPTRPNIHGKGAASLTEVMTSITVQLRPWCPSREQMAAVADSCWKRWKSGKLEAGENPIFRLNIDIECIEKLHCPRAHGYVRILQEHSVHKGERIHIRGFSDDGQIMSPNVSADPASSSTTISSSVLSKLTSCVASLMIARFDHGSAQSSVVTRG